MSGTSARQPVQGGAWGMRFPLAAAVVSLLLGLAAPPVWADTEQDKAKVDAAVAAAGDDLRAANAKVDQAIKDLEEARTLLPGARRELREARQEASDAEAADEEAQAELEQATAAAIRAEQEHAEVEFQIGDLQSRVGNLAREVYQYGAYADFDLLVSAGSPTELADRAAALDAVSRMNNTTLAEMAEIRADLALKEARLELMRQRVEEKRQEAAVALKRAKIARDRAEAAKVKVDLLVAKRATALTVASAERASVLKQYKSVQAEQARIAALLAKEAAEEAARLAAGRAAKFTPSKKTTSAKSRSSGGGGPGRKADPQSSDGMRWPLPGVRPAQGVGPRVHPVYGYRSCHTGIDLGAVEGTPIRPIAEGLVLSASTGDGPFGNHMIVAHGDGLFSMYAHQSRFAAEPGQTVDTGDVIGYVGNTGYSTGPHLHLEIHVGGTPYDPMGWFGGEKVPVDC